MDLPLCVFSGDDVQKYFKHEIGVHKWQRVSPTEKRGRVHTSCITVSVMNQLAAPKFILNRNEVERKYTRGSGAGGQHRNKVETVVVLTHLPTGLIVRVDGGRDRHKNEETAWKEMERRLSDEQSKKELSAITNEVREQIGVGNRNDKRRTYRVKDDIVIDHITGKTAQMKDILRGKLEKLA